MKSKKGFTLIELLVVIAIIGILAAIVLVSLRGAPARAKNARIMANVTQARAIAALIYSDSAYGNFTELCAADTLNQGLAGYPQLGTLEADINELGVATVTCYSSAEEYCISVQLLVNAGYFCVDGTGVTRSSTAAPACSAANIACY